MGSSDWQTKVFTAPTFAQRIPVMVIRSEHEPLFTVGFGSNLPLLGAVLLGAAPQLAVIYMPVMNEFMKTEPLTAIALAACVLVPGTVFLALGIEKWLVRRGPLYRNRGARVSPGGPARPTEPSLSFVKRRRRSLARRALRSLHPPCLTR